MPMSPLPHNSSLAVVPAQEFSSEERSQLLRLAHDSITVALDHREISLDPPTPHFAEPRGAFTSLYLRPDRSEPDLSEEDRREEGRPEKARREKVLRGCVGYVLATCPLYRAVAETARAAAFEDNRFKPVTKEEAPHLEIELSILSAPQPIPAEEIEVGRHGLLIAWHGRRGLLLPQVPVERGWDRTTFLEQTCRKAGLHMDAWQQSATLKAFTAEVFGDKNL